MKRALLAVLLALLASGCATRHSFAELGYPQFDESLPKGSRIQLARGVQPDRGTVHGWISADTPPEKHTYMPAAQAPLLVKDGADLICTLRARPRGDVPIQSLVVLAYALPEADVAGYKATGRVPRTATFLTGSRADKPEPDGEWFEVAFRIPLVKLEGAKAVALPYLALFKHGWVTVSFPLAPLPS